MEDYTKQDRTAFYPSEGRIEEIDRSEGLERLAQKSPQAHKKRTPLFKSEIIESK
jgi:hypothetical protein